MNTSNFICMWKIIYSGEIGRGLHWQSILAQISKNHMEEVCICKRKFYRHTKVKKLS